MANRATSEERTSHAVGTTVRIIDFLKSIPVRRQNALKQTTKTISSIRKTVQAYALARPAIRYSLKVLKAKNDKGCFTYAPKSEASVFDAATKIVGTKVIEQCQWKVWPPHERVSSNVEQDVNHTTNPEGTFTIEALLPTLGCGKNGAIFGYYATNPFACRFRSYQWHWTVCVSGLKTSVTC